MAEGSVWARMQEGQSTALTATFRKIRRAYELSWDGAWPLGR